MARTLEDHNLGELLHVIGYSFTSPFLCSLSSVDVAVIVAIENEWSHSAGILGSGVGLPSRQFKNHNKGNKTRHDKPRVLMLSQTSNASIESRQKQCNRVREIFHVIDLV